MVRTFLKVYMELDSTEEEARAPSQAGSMASSVFSDRTAGSSYATEALSAEMKAKLVKIILYRKMTGTMSKNSVPNGELNPLRPHGGCPLQAGTGHGRPGLRADADVR